ncbi:MFS transporter [Nocardia crassostreae]|uniref:MFS transporter n=1 Tax=Nocardia crassostreae TaxID=53428 RepID=UPI000829D7DA|nr:MFS transporter [Nocardia crassostreae]
MAAATPAPPIRIARFALFAIFGLNGLLSAIWIVHIPAVTQRTGVSHSTLGMLLLVMAAAAIAGMQAAGPLADRFGSRTLTTAAAAGLSASLLGLGYTTSTATLAIALLAYGFCNGALDVSMNAQAVVVERAYPRPIMSAFHAFFSLGGLLGAVAGAAAQRADWTIHTTFTVSMFGGLTVVALCAPRMLGPAVPARNTAAPISAAQLEPGTPGASAPTGERTANDPAPARRTTPHQHGGPPKPRRAVRPWSAAVRRGTRHGISRKVLLLGMIAFALLMAEGVAADWSALQLRDRLEVDTATAALAFAAFSTTMTLGRLGADRVSGRFGRVAVVRWGTLLAAFGFALILVSPWLPVTLAGWALCGIGLSGGVPQVFTAAGNLGSAASATDMSRVFGLGYIGLLAGPAIIGWLTELMPLTVTMAVPLATMLLCAWGARAVAPVR